MAEETVLDRPVARNLADDAGNSEQGADEITAPAHQSAPALQHDDALDGNADKMSTNPTTGTSAKALLNTTSRLSERQEMIRIISNRLFVALFALMAITMLGGYLTWQGHAVSAGATNWMVMLCGAIGGFIFLQRRLKTLTEGDLLLLARSWVYVLLSPLVGGILALLLYFLFIGQLLEGALFPEFVINGVTETGAGASPTDNAGDSSRSGVAVLFSVKGAAYTDYAKLIFWCFLAGYSESFVTNIISRFESDSDDKPV